MTEPKGVRKFKSYRLNLAWKMKFDNLPVYERHMVQRTVEAQPIYDKNTRKFKEGWLENINKHLQQRMDKYDYEELFGKKRKIEFGNGVTEALDRILKNDKINFLSRQNIYYLRDYLTEDQILTLDYMYNDHPMSDNDLADIQHSVNTFFDVPLGGINSEYKKQYEHHFKPTWWDTLTLGKYMGPGNSLVRGKPDDKVDAIAREHDIAYAQAQSQDDITKADKHMVDSLLALDVNGYEYFKKLAGQGGIGLKSWFESKFGVQYPQGLPTSINTGNKFNLLKCQLLFLIIQANVKKELILKILTKNKKQKTLKISYNL